MINLITDLETLRTPAESLTFLTKDGISKEEGAEVINKLKTVLEEHPDFISIAAPQIGINKRIFCVRFNDQIKTFINPIITKKKKSMIAPEVMTSVFPGKEFLLARPSEITVVYTTGEFKYEDNTFLNSAARVIDQQCQLLDGILPDDLGIMSDVEEDGSLFKCTDEELNQLAEIYKQFVKLKHQAIENELKEDDEVHKQYRKLKFTEDVINGRSLVIQDEPPLNREQRRNLKKKKRK